MTITEKVKLKAAIERGETIAITALFDELQRLESVIKDYEIGIRQITERFHSPFFKKPSTQR